MKGRDWYDLVWYAANHPELNLAHLEMRMRQSGHWKGEDSLSADSFRSALGEAIDALDVEKARREVSPFVKDQGALALWSREFFHDVAGRIRCSESPPSSLQPRNPPRPSPPSPGTPGARATKWSDPSFAPAEAGRDITAAYFAANADYGYFRMDLRDAPDSGSNGHAPLYSILIGGSSNLNTFAMPNPFPPHLLMFASGGSPSLVSSQQTGAMLEWAVKRSDLPGTFSWYGLSGNYNGSGLSGIFDITTSAVATPIPSAALLLATGIIGLVGLRRKSLPKA